MAYVNAVCAGRVMCCETSCLGKMTLGVLLGKMTLGVLLGEDEAGGAAWGR